MIAISELEKQNPFKNLPRIIDGIVFLIRPNGFKSFAESYELAEKANLQVAYEPVDSAWVLEFSKEID
jgi:hypothetical protein